MTGIAKPAQQKIDGVSYARVLRGEGGIERKAFFNYFPHGKSPGKAGGVWVRSGEWKLIRWFGVAVGNPERFELYNLRDDLSETKNLAESEAARVKELDALIDGFLADTGATYPRPNPKFEAAAAKPANPKASANSGDPLDAWKARFCEASVKDGTVTVTGTGKAGNAFLGHGMAKASGPATVKLRVRSAAGGDGRIDILSTDKDNPSVAQTVAFKVNSGDWQEVSVNLAASGPLGTLRVYLPVSAKPVEVDWIEVAPKSGKAQRWDFNAK